MSARPETREEAGLRGKAMILASVIALVALVVGALIGDRGILRLFEERARVDALAAEIGQLERLNDRLAHEILELRSDPRPIERLAREELGLAAPGETVFIIRRSPPTRP
jgi:cell division protein FtsB